MSGKKAVVIGAGMAGMAVAIRLRKVGYEVTVYESASTYGGKIKEYKWHAYRFDAGPSLFTLPELVDELFILCNKDPRAYFSYRKLKTVTRYFYDDGVEIDSFSEPKDFAGEIKSKLGLEEKLVLDFLEIQRKNYKVLAPVFLENPIHMFSKLFKIKNIPALLKVANPAFLLSMNKVNSDYFKNSHLTKLFNRYGTYNGSNPYKMPSLFNIISHLEHNAGAYLPEKGMRSIADSVYRLAIEEGVGFEFESYVSEIKCEKSKVKGIMVNGNFVDAHCVVSNMDVNNTYSKLLPGTKSPGLYLENEKSTSALIFHWAMEGRFPQIDVHNILFAREYKEEFDFLFTHKKLYHDPTVYIYVSAKAVNGDAPAGGENWFVMINTPHLTGNENWNELKETSRELVIKKIEKYLGFNIKDKIRNENCITPETIQNATHSYLGSLYGGSSNSLLSAFIRHPNFSKVKGLYFCGGSVHPGGGIPLCLLSAKITANLVSENDIS